MHDPDCKYMSPAQKKRAKQYSLEDVQKILDYCEKNQIGLMTWYSEYYPEQLKNIYNPPVLFFYRGNPAFLKNENMLTIVGTRHPSEYSLYAAKRLCSELAAESFTLVSGFALGLDTAAHEAALEQSKPTIAVLGCGIDQNYPKGSRMMKEKIAETGLILTEYFPGMPPRGSHFPIRNRILAGLGEAVLVTEAKENSGCLITANYACEQGKPVFCIPPSDIYNQRYTGQIKLIREGAVPVFGKEDLQSILLKQKNEQYFMSSSELEELPEVEFSEEELPPSRSDVPVMTKELTQEALTEKEKQIIDILFKNKKTVNMLCIETGMQFSEIVRHLIELEMLGWIEGNSSDFYRLTPEAQEKYTA
ncbi:MAG: DNA-processing protein DprA, partial [Oscillospiraceae bacterium]|nr:DNA-processing protein DprA [Oscillospiraceae bacterium]